MKQGALAGYKIASFETTYDHVKRIYDSTVMEAVQKLQYEAANSGERIKA